MQRSAVALVAKPQNYQLKYAQVTFFATADVANGRLLTDVQALQPTIPFL